MRNIIQFYPKKTYTKQVMTYSVLRNFGHTKNHIYEKELTPKAFLSFSYSKLNLICCYFHGTQTYPQGPLKHMSVYVCCISLHEDLLLLHALFRVYGRFSANNYAGFEVMISVH